jgi:uncharacterized membrane protein (DUF485 family)
MGEVEWVRISRTAAFQELVRTKRAFLIPATIFFLAFYFGLPVLIAFTTVLDTKVVGAINLAYVYAFAQFATTLGLSHLYFAKAKAWDELAEQTKRDAAEGGVETE